MMVWRDSRKPTKYCIMIQGSEWSGVVSGVATDAVRLLIVVTVELQLELLLIKYQVSSVMMVQPG